MVDWVFALLVAAQVPLVPANVNLGPCPDYAMPTPCYVHRTRTVYLNGTGTFAYHEFGHAHDLTVLFPRHRQRLKSLMGFPAEREWWDGEPDGPAELYAGYYSWCAQGKRVKLVNLQRVCRFIWEATPLSWRISASAPLHRKYLRLNRIDTGI